MKKMKRNNFLILLLAGIVLLGGGLFSCNKDFPNTLTDEFNNDLSTLNLGTRKALVVVIDGAVGAEVKAVAPKNLTLMSDFSIYSYDALSDYFGSEPMAAQRGWANVMTGVYANKHGVDSTDLTDGDFTGYPSFVTRLKKTNKVDKIDVFSTSQDFVDDLASDADTKKVSATDADVKSSAVQALGQTDASVVLAHFSDVETAGLNGGFEVTNSEYKDAITNVDSEIGELLSAMRGRSSFDKENWLVIVVSGNGSVVSTNPSTTTNAFNDSRRNGLFFMYNPRFNSQSALRPGAIIPYIGTSPLYNGKQNGSYSSVLDDGGLYDFGASGSFTIQCKVKIKSGEYYYPAVLGKRESWSGGHPGWVFFLEGGFWQINFGQTGQGNQQVRGYPVNDNQWHTLTAVIKQDGAQRNVYTFTDGVKYPASTNIAGKGNINTTRPLMAGHFDEDGGSGPDNFFVTDIRIYNTALPDDYIAANFSSVSVPASDPYFSNLLGFWKGTSVDGNKQMQDFSGNNKPMTVNLLNAVSFTDATPNVNPDISTATYRTVPNSVDVATQLYLWFGVIVDSKWQLDGRSWVPTYIDLNN